MSVDFSLFRASSEDEFDEASELSFGNQQEIIERLCSTVGFEYDHEYNERQLAALKEYQKEQISSDMSPMSIIFYCYHHEDDMGRAIEYYLQGDPVTCISINRAYPEDFLPIIEALEDLEPFVIFGPDGTLQPEELDYSYDEWIEMNYEDNEL